MFCEGCVNLIWREFKNGLDEFSERKCMLDSSSIKNNLVLCHNRVFKEEKVVDVVDKIKHEALDTVPGNYTAINFYSDPIIDDNTKCHASILEEEYVEPEKLTVPDNVPVKRGRGRPKRG